MPIEKFDVRNRWTGAVQFTAEIKCAPATAHCAKLGLAVRWAQKSGASLRGADLSGAVLSGASLSGADLRGAYLSGARLSGADLSGADLSGASLSGADLRGAVLSGADLSRADLGRADLSGARLSGARLSGADLSDADLSDAVLCGADLSDADLRRADLGRADLGGAYLGGAYLGGAYLGGADLRPFKADLWMTLTENVREVPALVEALKAGRVDGSQYEGECACLVGTIAKAKGVDHTTLHHNASDPAERWFAMIREGDKPGDDSGGGYAAAIALAWIEEWQWCHALAAGADR